MRDAMNEIERARRLRRARLRLRSSWPAICFDTAVMSRGTVPPKRGASVWECKMGRIAIFAALVVAAVLVGQEFNWDDRVMWALLLPITYVAGLVLLWD